MSVRETLRAALEAGFNRSGILGVIIVGLAVHIPPQAHAQHSHGTYYSNGRYAYG